MCMIMLSSYLKNNLKFIQLGPNKTKGLMKYSWCLILFLLLKKTLDWGRAKLKDQI